MVGIDVVTGYAYAGVGVAGVVNVTGVRVVVVDGGSACGCVVGYVGDAGYGDMVGVRIGGGFVDVVGGVHVVDVGVGVDIGGACVVIGDGDRIYVVCGCVVGIDGDVGYIGSGVGVGGADVVVGCCVTMIDIADGVGVTITCVVACGACVVFVIGVDVRVGVGGGAVGGAV